MKKPTRSQAKCTTDTWVEAGSRNVPRAPIPAAYIAQLSCCTRSALTRRRHFASPALSDIRFLVLEFTSVSLPLASLQWAALLLPTQPAMCPVAPENALKPRAPAPPGRHRPPSPSLKATSQSTFAVPASWMFSSWVI